MWHMIIKADHSPQLLIHDLRLTNTAIGTDTCLIDGEKDR